MRRSRLTTAQIAAIKADKRRYAEIAAEHGISIYYAHLIKNGHEPIPADAPRNVEPAPKPRPQPNLYRVQW